MRPESRPYWDQEPSWSESWDRFVEEVLMPRKLICQTKTIRCPSCRESYQATHEQANPERQCPRCGYRWVRG